MLGRWRPTEFPSPLFPPLWRVLPRLPAPVSSSESREKLESLELLLLLVDDERRRRVFPCKL